MDETQLIPFDDLAARVEAIFVSCGLSAEAATSLAAIITAAERDGCKSHGIYRIEGCLQVVAAGRVVPDAVPEVRDSGKPVLEVLAHGGFSAPAFDAARSLLIERTRSAGLAALVIRDGLHFSALWHDVEALADAGLASISTCPSYAVVAPAGGTRPLLGTNPLAFGWPRPGGPPFVFDLATSVVARGEIELCLRAGEPIPEGWALDRDGRATTDPAAALEGALLPFGGYKGSAISTMIELLAGAMLGERMSREARDFMVEDGLLPRHGALVLAFDPATFAASSGRDPLAEGERLLTAIAGQGARLPSQRRYAARERAMARGIELGAAELAQLDAFERHGLAALDR